MGDGAMNIKGKARITCEISGLKKSVNFYVVENKNYCLIGLPTLKSFKITLNMEDEQMTCNNFISNYVTQKGIMGQVLDVNMITREDCNLSLTESVTIPAGKQMVVFAKVEMDEVPDGTLIQVSGDYAATRYGLIAPRSISEKKETVPVILKNWYETDIKLYKNSKIGKASLCELRSTEKTLDMKTDNQEKNSPDNHPVD